jgi:hypothetical protein
MPDDTSPVTWKDFRSAMAFVLLKQQQQSELFAALLALLVQQNTISGEVLRKTIENARNSETSRKARESLATLADSLAIQDILKNFEGPIQ